MQPEYPFRTNEIAGLRPELWLLARRRIERPAESTNNLESPHQEAIIAAEQYNKKIYVQKED